MRVRLLAVVTALVLLGACLPAANAESASELMIDFCKTSFADEQMMPVYSGPDTAYYRAARGKAACSTNGDVYVAGWEGSWLLILYEVSGGAWRCGYVKSSSFTDSISAPTLSFSFSAVTLAADAALTDDPYGTGSALTTLAAGDSVTLLKLWSCRQNGASWAYVEAGTADGSMRGFIPAGAVGY